MTVRKAGSSEPNVGDGVHFDLWEPGCLPLLPEGVPRSTYMVFWGFHHLHVFRNRDFAVVVGRRGDEVVHRLSIFPPSFRFPFMGRTDLQIGDVWTAPKERGRGIAGRGIAFALARRATIGRRFWYLVEDDNRASIRVAERVGFEKVATATRTSPLGSRLLGQFRLLSSDPQQ